MSKSTPDWEAVESAVRAGVLSIRAIAKIHGVSDAGIRKKMKQYGWERDLSEQVRKEVRSKLVRTDVRVLDNDAHATDEEIISEAAEIGVTVVRGHRKDINKAAELSRMLMDDLKQAIENREEIKASIQIETKSDVNGNRRNGMMAAVSLPSNAKTLYQLTSALRNLQTLERIAFSLDEKAVQNPGEQPSESEIDKRIAELARKAGAADES